MDYEKLYNTVNSIFTKDFKKSYKAINIKDKSVVLKYINSFYRKWYYSALVENTVLTPSNLLMDLNQQYNKSPFVLVVPKVSSTTRISNIIFTKLEYCLDDHFVVNDLEIFLKSCMPDFELSINYELSEEHQERLLPQLSIFDPFYIEFLCIISLNLNLITRIPSIHSKKAQITDNYEKIFMLKKREIFDKIVKISVSLATVNINGVMILNGYITDEYIYSILKKPIDTDALFSYIFAGIGISTDKALEQRSEDMDEIYSSMISGAFHLGIIVDKFFFTVFGYYLRLINLNYFLLPDLYKDMLFFIESIINHDDLNISIFSPCSKFDLTDLGFEYFHIPKEMGKYQYFKEGTSPSGIIKSFDNETNFDRLINRNIANWKQQDVVYRNSELVYELKISMDDNKPLWKKMEFLEESTLKDLYFEICYEFNLDINLDYSFYQEIGENPFSEYPSVRRKKREKTPQNPKLREFTIDKGHKFKLVLYDIANPYIENNKDICFKKIKFEVEVFKVKEKNLIYDYPRFIGEGVAFGSYGMFDDN